MNLTSQKTGNILMIFLIISIVVGALYMLTTYFFAYHYDEVYLSIAEWDQIIMSADSIIWIVACIIFLIWIYMVCVD